MLIFLHHQTNLTGITVQFSFSMHL